MQQCQSRIWLLRRFENSTFFKIKTIKNSTSLRSTWTVACHLFFSLFFSEGKWLTYFLAEIYFSGVFFLRVGQTNCVNVSNAFIFIISSSLLKGLYKQTVILLDYKAVLYRYQSTDIKSLTACIFNAHSLQWFFSWNQQHRITWRLSVSLDTTPVVVRLVRYSAVPKPNAATDSPWCRFFRWITL